MRRVGSRELSRAAFLAATAALPVAAAASPLPIPADPTARLRGALVFGGGGARGAYEAGVIEGLRRAASIGDGVRIPGIDVVCGTSIGAINGWYVATGQYSALAQLWHGIASEHVFRLKRRYAALTTPSSGVLTRILQALSLAGGLTKNERGILAGEAIEDWLARHIDPHTPLLVPFVITATNLDRERAELFYRLPFKDLDAARTAAIARIRSSVGPTVAVRPAPDELLQRIMRASAAIPVLFDPVVMAAPEGTVDRYVDGGIADNNPIDVARAVAGAVYAVMVDPPAPTREPYNNALSIGVGSFGIAQTRILEASLRATYIETQGKRLFRGGTLTPEQRHFLDTVLDTDLFTVRPPAELDVQVPEFDRQDKIDAAYDAGVRDIAGGWRPYVFAT